MLYINFLSKLMVPLIQIQNLSKSFVSGKTKSYALDDISLTVEKNEIFGIIGLSGAGKSTLIRCLARLVTPTDGKILFKGQDLASFDKLALRSFHKSIGMIFQHFHLLESRNVAQNIAFPLEIAHIPQEQREQRVDELLKLVGLYDKKQAYPCQLSGGEKQRVGIARALANEPELLLCDEATSALDPKTTSEILALLKKIHENLGITIVLITHEMDVVRQLCTHVACLDKGKVVEHGKVAAVFSAPQHPTTKRFLQTTTHTIPKEFFKVPSPERKLMRLSFKGSAASQPLLSDIVRKFDVSANILLGWIDRVQEMNVGTLVVELTGKQEMIEKALLFFNEHQVHHEEVSCNGF